MPEAFSQTGPILHFAADGDIEGLALEDDSPDEYFLTSRWIMFRLGLRCIYAALFLNRREV
jgi:hypothetical protein